MISTDDIYAALRSYLLSVTPITEVYQAQDTRVPIPVGQYTIMTILRRERMSTGHDTTDAINPVMTTGQVTSYTVQVDIYGDGAGNHAAKVEQLWRTIWSVDLMHSLNAGITPLYADTVFQTSLINSEANYEERYTLSLHMQVQQDIDVAQDIFKQITLAPQGTRPADLS